MTNSIELEQIQEFAAAWFHALDVHAPAGECWSMLADNDLNMHFPDGDIHDFATFRKWYERVINLFFDEQHTIRELKINSSGSDQAEISVIVEWQSVWWEPPEALSRRINLEATQTWTVRRCPSTKNAFGLEIVGNHMVGFEHMPGSAELPAAPNTENELIASDELVALNERIGEMEQQQGEEAADFFDRYLSGQLVFRRVSGKTVGKSGPEGFLESLKKPNPFSFRQSEDISVNLLGDRALVTLIVRTGKEDGTENRYRNIRLFSRSGDDWLLEFWYNYEITSL